MPILQLTKSYCSLIDEEDADLGGFKWAAHETSYSPYARRSFRIHGPPKPGSKGGPAKRAYLHRVILERMFGRLLARGEEVDHVNHDGLDNRRCNLRLATSRQNKGNTRVGGGAYSTFRGVHWHRKLGKWTAHISRQNKSVHLGVFTDERDAARAYNEAAKEHFGEFARLNEVD